MNTINSSIQLSLSIPNLSPCYDRALSKKSTMKVAGIALLTFGAICLLYSYREDIRELANNLYHRVRGGHRLPENIQELANSLPTSDEVTLENPISKETFLRDIIGSVESPQDKNQIYTAILQVQRDRGAFLNIIYNILMVSREEARTDQEKVAFVNNLSLQWRLFDSDDTLTQGLFSQVRLRTSLEHQRDTDSINHFICLSRLAIYVRNTCQKAGCNDAQGITTFTALQRPISEYFSLEKLDSYLKLFSTSINLSSIPSASIEYLAQDLADLAQNEVEDLNNLYWLVETVVDSEGKFGSALFSQDDSKDYSNINFFQISNLRKRFVEGDEVIDGVLTSEGEKYIAAAKKLLSTKEEGSSLAEYLRILRQLVHGMHHDALDTFIAKNGESISQIQDTEEKIAKIRLEL